MANLGIDKFVAYVNLFTSEVIDVVYYARRQRVYDMAPVNFLYE